MCLLMILIMHTVIVLQYCCHQTHYNVSKIICKAIPFCLNAYYYDYCALLSIVPHTFKFKVSIFCMGKFFFQTQGPKREGSNTVNTRLAVDRDKP